MKIYLLGNVKKELNHVNVCFTVYVLFLLKLIKLELWKQITTRSVSLSAVLTLKNVVIFKIGSLVSAFFYKKGKRNRRTFWTGSSNFSQLFHHSSSSLSSQNRRKCFLYRNKRKNMDFIIGTKMNARLFLLAIQFSIYSKFFLDYFCRCCFWLFKTRIISLPGSSVHPENKGVWKLKKKAFVHFQLHDCVLVYKPTNVHAFQFILYNGEGWQKP